MAFYSVTLEGQPCQDTRNSFNLPNTVTKADIGKAVTVDTTVNNGVKLAGNNDPILGQLTTVEVTGTGVNAKVVGMVTCNGGFQLPVKAGETVTRGTIPVGAGGGEIKSGVASTDFRFYVTSIEKLGTELSVTVYRQ